MKKTLALVLAFALVFSTMTVAFADDAAISADAKVCADLGMLVGDGNGVTAAYTATAPTRIQAAVMVLRLKGLEAEAKAFTGTDNFADASKAAWAAPIMAYLKAHPELGWAGDGTNFDPAGAMTAQAYYKVMLETLGYKQNTATVVGDFTWEKVVEFAATKGLTKVAAATNFTVADLATATVETLKANMKDGGKSLVATLVEAGKVDAAKATTAGIYTAAPVAPAVAVDKAKAVGNATVDVTYADDVDATAATAALYTIEGLEIKSAAVAASDRIRLETAAMTTGKVYTLTVGGKSVKFTAVTKVSGGPEIETVESKDVEEVVINFNKNIDLTTGTNVANFTITGVQIAKAEVDKDEVTLTTVGLKNKTKYTVKVANLKSIDGVSKKSDSKEFRTDVDTTAPKLAADPSIEVQTNDRIKVTFNEKVTEASAEAIANYTIKENKTDGETLEVKSVVWNDDDEDSVLITTDSMTKNKEYKLSLINLADQRKVANVNTRPVTKTFKAVGVDTIKPVFKSAVALSPTTVLVTFEDSSSFNEATCLDLNNYSLKDMNIESITTVDNDWKVFKGLLTVEEMETGKNYDLTVVDVLDEFGNAMKETKISVKASATSFASAKMLTYKVVGEKKVELTFDQQLDETSAENISNYSIDNGIGAPTKATLDSTGKKVTLETNALVDGKDDYYVIVDGVQDLAGNVLYFKKYLANTDAWDTEAPGIDGFSVLNKYVASMTFDEKVKFAPKTKLILAVDTNHAHDITLYANDLRDDDTVVEFAYNGKEELTAANYTVVKFVYLAGVEGGLTDLIGNPVIVTGLTDTYDSEGSTEDADLATVDSYEQTNGTNFDVTMNRWVNLVDNGALVSDNGDGSFDVKTTDSKYTFVVTVDEDVLTFHIKTGKLAEDGEYNFDFTQFVTDKHGIAAENADSDTVTILDGTDTDDVAPEVDTVTTRNREVIRITFTEDILDSSVNLDASDFTLKNYDLDKDLTFKAVKDIDGDNIIDLVLDKPLEGRYEYALTLKGKHIQDFAGNWNATDDATFYFNGTNLANIIY